MEHFEDLGFRFSLIVMFSVTAGLLLLTLITGLIALIGARARGEQFFDSVWSVACAAFGVFTVMAVCFFVGSLVPFDSKYHHTYRVSGEVTEVSNTLNDSNGDLTRNHVITMDGVDRDIVMEDPRAVNLQGKNVDLTCNINWVYLGADEYLCKIYNIT